MTHSQANSSFGTDPTLNALNELITVVAKLRSPDGGCPWDLAQTPQTLIPYVIEEAYEVVDAIRQGDSEAIADELGDLLLQVVLHAQIASESGQFDLATIADLITAKLIRRHPHVFGTVVVESTDEVHENWERIKADEEQTKRSGSTASPDGSPSSHTLSPRLRRYARSLPPLMAGMKISKKAAQAGFEWETVDGVWEKFEEELAELKEAIAHESKERQESELGDVLFTLINVARWHDLDPSEALQETNRRFIQRFSQVEAAAGRSLADYSPDELEALWQQAKAQLIQE
ncbi:MAG: nucleoside triphosphate pyrophosphohydrolase [Elainellaceae cyanobacterium]